MATCPNGHSSEDPEFCDVCGLAMDAAPAPAAPPKEAAAPATPSACPSCGTPLAGRFCEECGHDSLATPPPRAESRQEPEPQPVARGRAWTATVSADRAYFDTVMAIGGPDAGDIAFPQFCPDRYFPLPPGQSTVGRRSVSRGIDPDIDLTGPPEDPGVSHMHAMLLVEPDGGLSIVDLGSSNGTTVNDEQTSLRPNVARHLSNGDRIHLGAWTTITVRAG